MKKMLTTLLLICLISAACGVLLFYVAGFTARKSVWIAGGAGVAMMLFDVLIPFIRGRRNDFV
jgi:hypothetical protein